MPPPLKDVSLLALDVGLLQAGASMKGEFENRLRAGDRRGAGVAQADHPVHRRGAHADRRRRRAGTGDAANLLKPALARGTLRTIAATTWAEYKKYIEKDPALTRRFQVVQVDEPSEDKAILMMRGVASVLEKHHRVQVLDEAIEAAVRLSHRYIPARQLPDKAVSLLDTACARVAISQHAVPPEVEDCRRRIEALDTELEIIGREEAVGIDASERRTAAEQKRAAADDLRRGSSRRAGRREGDSSSACWRSARRCARASAPVEGTGSTLEKAAEAQKDPAVTPAPAAPTPAEREALLTELKGLQSKLTRCRASRR